MIKWTDEMVDALRVSYPDLNSHEIANKLGVSRGAVNTKACELGIRKSETFVNAQRERVVAGGAKYRFKKGDVAWNKGKKGYITVTDAMRATMFKAGHKPHNTTCDGHISVTIDERGVKQLRIRISEKNHEYLSRHNYRKAFGGIPHGYCIKFKDGNTLNCDPDNLECVSRTLLMLLNSKHGYTRDIAEVKEVICYIKQEIKEPTGEK